MKPTRISFFGATAAALLFAGACGGSQAKTSQASNADPAGSDGDPLGLSTKTPETPKVVATGTPSGDLIPRSVFYGNPDRAGVQLSSDGKHLSWLADSDGVMNIWVAPRGDLAAAKAITKSKKRPISQYFWAFDNQHVLYMQDAGGNEDFHIYSVNLKTGEERDLTPMDKIRATFNGVSYKKPGEILIGLNNRDPRFHDVHRVNLKSGKSELVYENPGFAGFQFDDNYKLLLGTKQNAQGGMDIMKYSPVKAKKTDGKPDPMADWKPFMSIGMEDALSTSPIATDRSGKNIYMWDSRGRNTRALYSMNLKTGKKKLISGDDKIEAGGLILHPTKRTVMAVGFTRERTEWKILDKSLKRDLAKLAKVDGGELRVVDGSLDDKTWIVQFVRDDGPAKYYLWDRRAQKETFLFSNRKELEGLKLSKMHPRTIKARDGLELVNYLSLPVDSDPEADGVPSSELPMVLLVHGGPWSRDGWGYDSLHQHLANRGYAVLSVNFRGSTGLGKDFLNAGNREWAGKMHDDLLDSVQWAVDQKIANKDKVCIMGGSYGGYATLVGLAMTPDTFACGVDIVGPSSIMTLLSTIPPYWEPLKKTFKMRVGDWETEEGKAALIKASPLTHVDKIKKPLLIGQGANDPRVKQAESDQIVTAMNEKNIPVSYVLFPDEGHGFRRRPNRLVFFAAVEAFLSAHIGGKYEPATPDEFTGTTVKVPEGAHGIPGFPALLDGLK